MAGSRRLGGEFHALGDWDWKVQANRFSFAGCRPTGPRCGYQIRAVGRQAALWWVDYHTSNGEENRRLAQERLIGVYPTEREAELEARQRMARKQN